MLVRKLQLLHRCTLLGRRILWGSEVNAGTINHLPLTQFHTSYAGGSRTRRTGFLCLLSAAPAFVAHFKKKTTDEEDEKHLPFWLKLIPKRYRIAFQKEDNSAEGKLTMALKRTLLMVHKNEMEKAEQMAHVALRMAQDMQHFNGITLCFDIMANLAMEREQYEKAEKLFVIVLQRLLQSGKPQDDVAVLHISMKMAQIAASRNDSERAELGYKFVMDNLKRKFKDDPADMTLYEFVGIVNNK